MKNKIILIFLLVLSFSNFTTAQSFKDHLFTSRGGFLGYGIQPGFLYTSNNKTYAAQYSYVNYFAYSYKFRLNVVESTENMAFAVSFAPSVNASSGHFERLFYDGGLGVMMDLGVSLNFGAGATYKAEANNGIAIEGGFTLKIVPLLAFKDTSLGVSTPDITPKKTYVNPYIGILFRHWKQDFSRLKCYFFRYEFLKNSEEVSGYSFIKKPISWQIGMYWFLDKRN